MAGDREPWRAFLDLANHTVLVAAAFVVIFAVAIGLDLLARNLVAYSVLTLGSPLYWALIGAKYFLVAVDVVILVVLVVKLAWRTIKRF